jgi:amino acid adenylation domain-containing protein
LGLVYLLTDLKRRFGSAIDGRIYKSGNDFNSFEELKELVEQFNPDLVGIRTLTFFREFLHETAALLRQWGVDVPIITGGPYASSDFDTILKDRNIDLVTFGEGEETLAQVIEAMLENDFRLPAAEELKKITGVAFTTNGGEQDDSREVLLLDRLAGALEGEDTRNLQPAAIGSSLAYVMYTSGSTGKPKGVMVEHRQVNNCLHWMQEKFRLKKGDVAVQRTSLTFDPSVWEIFWPLTCGAAVRVLDRDRSRDASYLVRMLTENAGASLPATIMYTPATLLTAMNHILEGKTPAPTLTLPWLVIGAEPVAMDTVKSFYRCFDGKIVNTYGPTEGTINNTYYDLDPDDERTVVPIGKPVANNRIYILSGDMSLLPIKTAGEICIAGASVARGYIGDHAKTLEQFVDNPFGEGKLYRSGDIGRWLEDGNIEILGRVDDQVKIRGHRIEPGEIETALNSHPDIDSCIVVPKGGQELQEKTRECKQCGIWSNYPGIVINKDDICNYCENFDRYKRLITQYFKTMDDLEQKIREGADRKKGKYDCLLVYACERVATYALYRLLDMGLNILTVTYDSGHYDQESLERISEITKKMGVDHFFLRHERSDEILKESLRSAQTMCKGCIHTSSSLAGEYAYKNGIPFVIGETLSRGQIVENKLYKFMDMGITDVNELEREIDKLTKNTALIDKKIYDIIGIDIVSDGTIYDRVEFLDFYRYCDVSHDEMIAYLDEKDSYWKDLDTKAIYSTDCKICQVGNFNHLKHKGFHYTGSAKSWDQRMGLTTLQNVKDDLYIDMTTEEHAAFLGELGYVPEKSDGAGGKYLCAYYIAENGRELTVSQLRNWLSGRIPEYMIPSFFIKLEEMPLTGNGKIDRKALPSPEGFRPKLSCTFVAPRTDMEKIIAGIWKEVLKTELAGVEDNFFDLGGSSLDIIQMGNKLQDITGKEIPVVTLFSNPTIAALAKHLDNGGESQTTAETAAQRKQTLDEGKNTMKQTFAKFGK